MIPNHTKQMQTQSPASRGRGLKLVGTAGRKTSNSVARFARAWIEPSPGLAHSVARTSPASRGRGLKHPDSVPCVGVPASPASRGRGLKHVRLRIMQPRSVVARFARAWIETLSVAFSLPSAPGRPLRAGVD